MSFWFSESGGFEGFRRSRAQGLSGLGPSRLLPAFFLGEGFHRCSIGALMMRRGLYTPGPCGLLWVIRVLTFEICWRQSPQWPRASMNGLRFWDSAWAPQLQVAAFEDSGVPALRVQGLYGCC